MSAFVGSFEVFQVLAAVSNEAEEAAARALVLTIFIQMSGKLFDSTRQNRDLDLRRAGVRIMSRTFLDLIFLLSLRQHPENVSHSAPFCKVYGRAGAVVVASTLTSFMSKRMVELAGIMVFPAGSLRS